MATIRRRNKIVIALLLLLFVACNQQPAEIHYRSDECAHCKMMIMDARFASQIVTPTGKAVKFDAIECMVAYRKDHAADTESSRFWINDFQQPGNWLAAEEAVIVKSREIQSPMGGSLLALPSRETARSHLEEYPGEIVSWPELTGR